MKSKILFIITIAFIFVSSHGITKAEENNDNDYTVYSLALNKLFASCSVFSQDSKDYHDSRFIFNIFIEEIHGSLCKRDAKKIAKYSKEMSRQMMSAKNYRRETPLVDSFNLDFKYQMFKSLDSIPHQRLKIFTKTNYPNIINWMP